MSIFIIEHLEPKLFEWCLIEYERISKIVGKNNLWFTNIKNKSDSLKLKKFGRVISNNVSELHLKSSCVLDPQSSEILKPSDKKIFKYFIFGGILGDYPPKKRTKKELTQFLPQSETRNIGKKQFSTDNAVFVVNEIINNRRNFKEIKFKSKAEIKINDVESIILPYLYPADKDGKPMMSEKIVSYLKKKKGF